MPAAQENLFKDQARRLRDRMTKLGVTVTHSHSLEGVAAVHGARDWNTLSAGPPAPLSAQDPDVMAYACEALAELVGIEPGQVLAASKDETGTVYAAVRYEDGSVQCTVVSAHRVGKTYCEGDAFACYPSRHVLEALSPSSDARVNLWRQSAWVSIRRSETIAQIERNEEPRVPPWCLYHSFMAIKCGIEGAHYCVATDDTGWNFEATNGEETAPFTMEPALLAGRSTMLPLSDEGWLHEGYNNLRRGREGMFGSQLVCLGPEGYQVGIEIGGHGGLVRWSALPFHFADDIEMHKKTASLRRPPN